MDLEKAYDSVNHELLWYKLQRVGIPPGMINLIKLIYQKMSLVQIDKYKLKSPIEINKEVLQGDPLSSVLFNLFLTDLDDIMKQAQAPKIMLKYSKKRNKLSPIRGRCSIVSGQPTLYSKTTILYAKLYYN